MKTSQNDLIYDHLRQYGSITPADALDRYGIMRLSGRIFDLKHMGVHIEADTETSVNRLGNSVRYARYRLTGKATQQEMAL